jgi:hypothetical protein
MPVARNCTGLEVWIGALRPEFGLPGLIETVGTVEHPFKIGS